MTSALPLTRTLPLPSATVRKPETLALGLDPKPLFELGLREVRANARALWTDHNIHDPGITTLELLCYALTDLCYRACYPVEDLLAVAGDNARSMADQFFSARRALPNAPLTELDYRRLMLDVDGVRNAWIYHVTDPAYYADAIEGKLLHDDPGLLGIREVRLRGLHGARIEYTERASAADKARIDAEVAQALQDNRCLCEDFVEVTAVQFQDFVLCAEIELQPDADALEVHAALLLVVQLYLAPGVRRYTRDEMLARFKADGARYTDPDLFEGPAPRRGFIDPDELAAAELRSTIRLSDVISEIMDVPGVKAVRDIVIRPTAPPAGAPEESKWEVGVIPGRRARLDPAGSRLVLYKGSMPLPRSPAVVERYEELKKEDEKKYAPRPSGDAPPILGRFRDAGVYESVQKHFPVLYGIGDAALPAGASLERQAQARQLQGWLLFFDQLMANDCAQLASLTRLFSVDPNLDHSYFSQAVDGLRDLYPPPDAAQQAAEAETGDSDAARDAARNAWRLRIQVMLDALAEGQPAMLRRRNRFLDHLMARFAERLQDYLEIQAALFGATPAAAARAKCAFLAQYPELGAERGLGYDFTREAPDNDAGLQRRLAHLLGLGGLTYDIYDERDTDGVEEYRFRVRRRFTDGVLLSSTRHWSTREEALAKMSEALAAAARPGGYRRTQTVGGEHSFNVVDADGHVVARRIQYFPTAAARDAAIDELIAIAAEHRSERLCIIENILLRPRPGSSDAFLPICAEPDCGPGCAGDDPYSYRLHIVLPALAGRFRSMDFRRFAEDVIRQETPAHLLPKICWVSDADMTRVENAWAAWRALLSGTDTTGRAAKFAELRDALYEAKNVYPAPTLADCEAAEKFILGRSALGSAPEA